ncbi:MAG: MurR/RpiR family transcriptional regulator [Coprobacillus sp.]
MQLESLVNQNYDQLNENDKIVIKQILTFQQDYRHYSCEQIADECHISRATLLRLCRKIGLSSFSDLKYLLKETDVLPTTTHNFHEVCNHYQLLINELQKISFHPICEVIDKANTIYIYGTGNEQKSLAQEMKRIFLSVGKCVIDLFDAGEIEFMKQSFDKDDLFIIVSLSGETKEGIDIINNIQGNVHTLSMTRLDNNTISTLCEYNLYVATQKLNVLEKTSYEVVGAFYVLLDLLFMNYIEYRRRKL